MSTIKYKTKLQTVYNFDDSIAFQYVSIPALTRSHCDMDAFRTSQRFGVIANSDFFLSTINNVVRTMGNCVDGRPVFRLDALPESVTIDDSGFLSVVTINFED